MQNSLLTLLFVSVLTVGCGPAEPEPEPEPEPEVDVPESKVEAAELTNQGKGDFGLDICKRNDWYGDGECDWFCFSRDEDCNADPIGPEPAGAATQYPIVLAHGFMGSPTNFWAFLNVAEALREDGHMVYEGEVPPFHSAQVRGERLAAQIDGVLEETGSEKVNIIAHSMGGVDSRHVISGLGYGDRIASLTTISSPHRGTGIADVALKVDLGDRADEAMDAVVRAIGGTFSNEADRTNLRASLESLSTETMPRFNDRHPDDERVYYQSWAGVSAVTGFANGDTDEVCEGKSLVQPGTYDRMDPLLWAVVPFVAGVSVVPNDGMATVESAKWGEFQGCIPTDHLDEVGQLSGEPDHNTGFDHIRFYRNIAYDLAARGH